jgi:hypothetical protein
VSAGASPERRAARLLLWYPRGWRERYGEEFAELLVSDIEDRPGSAGRALDVARSGITARLGVIGLADYPVVPAAAVTAGARYRQVSASLGALGCALAVFVTAAAAPWSELVIDRQAAAPGQRQAPSALLATGFVSAAMLALLALAALATLPVLATLVVRITAVGRAGRDGLRTPAAVLLAALAFLFIGGRHFGNGWPGTGGHGSFVPAGLAAFAWATSLSVSAYWAHPASLLATFPRPELYWMALSPLALAASVAAVVVLVRRSGLPPRLLAFEVRLAGAACAAMTVAVAATACWVATSGGPLAGPAGEPPFHAGLIDLACTTVLAAALPVAAQAARIARRELRAAGSRS